jgi:hypothetical protein
MPSLVAQRSKVTVCDTSFVGIAVSNPAGGMAVILVYRFMRRADHSSRAVLPTVCDTENSRIRRPWHALGCCAREKKNILIDNVVIATSCRLEGFGDVIPIGTTFSVPVQNGPEAQPTFCKMDTEFISRG